MARLGRREAPRTLCRAQRRRARGRCAGRAPRRALPRAGERRRADAVDRGGRAVVAGAPSRPGSGRRARPRRAPRVVGGVRRARRAHAGAGHAGHALPGRVGVEGGQRVRAAAAGRCARGECGRAAATARLAAAGVGVRGSRHHIAPSALAHRGAVRAWLRGRLAGPPARVADGLAARADGRRGPGPAGVRAGHVRGLLGRRVHGRRAVGDRGLRRAVRRADARHRPAPARHERQWLRPGRRPGRCHRPRCPRAPTPGVPLRRARRRRAAAPPPRTWGASSPRCRRR